MCYFLFLGQSILQCSLLPLCFLFLYSLLMPLCFDSSALFLSSVFFRRRSKPYGLYEKKKEALGLFSSPSSMSFSFKLMKNLRITQQKQQSRISTISMGGGANQSIIQKSYHLPFNHHNSIPVCIYIHLSPFLGTHTHTVTHPPAFNTKRSGLWSPLVKGFSTVSAQA